MPSGIEMLVSPDWKNAKLSMKFTESGRSMAVSAVIPEKA